MGPRTAQAGAHRNTALGAANMPRNLEAALRRFAGRAVHLEQEILRNPEFRSLCEDYGDAVEAVERWSQSSDAASIQRAAEYRNLVDDLEKEIDDHLKKTTKN